jgi:beta-glucosidase
MVSTAASDGVAADGGGADAVTLDANADADTADAADGGVEGRVEALLARMTLDEKVGQMTMGGWSSLASSDDITTYRLGALGGAPGDVAASDWLPITATVRAKAAATRLGIPVLVAIDAVHGNAKVKGATVFPHNIGLGCTRDPDIVRSAAAVTGSEMALLGLTLAESPDVDVGRDERWGRSYESFGEDPALVAMMATAAVQGFQTAVAACAKHAIGAGGTSWGTGVGGGIDQGNVEVGEAEMRRVHLPPFQAAIQAGVQVIMASYSSWQGTKMHASGKWLTDVLKGELGFDGVIMGDGGGVLQLGPSVQDDVLTAVTAGIDLINVGGQYPSVVAALKTLVVTGALPVARIDDAVRRILRVKMRSGLFDAAPPDPGALSGVGSAAHRAVARQAVRESLVLLENDGALLPLPKSARVHVAGRGADDLGIQSGGWTLGWQGMTGVDAAAMGGGTTLLDALRGAAASPSLVTYSADGTGAAGADVGVVVLHELPYAEYMGDVPDPRYDATAPANVYDGSAAAVVAGMRAANVPLVLVLLTGRPVRIESLLPSFGAVVAAWLPGSEGTGVADVLYGDAPFRGTLSRSWPKDATALPLTHDQTPYDPLFPFGFGLTH